MNKKQQEIILAHVKERLLFAEAEERKAQNLWDDSGEDYWKGKVDVWREIQRFLTTVFSAAEPSP